MTSPYLDRPVRSLEQARADIESRRPEWAQHYEGEGAPVLIVVLAAGVWGLIFGMGIMWVLS